NVPTASPLNKFLVGQFENNGGVFSFTTPPFFFSTPPGHPFNDRKQVGGRYHFCHYPRKKPSLNPPTRLSPRRPPHALFPPFAGFLVPPVQRPHPERSARAVELFQL